MRCQHPSLCTLGIVSKTPHSIWTPSDPSNSLVKVGSLGSIDLPGPSRWTRRQARPPFLVARIDYWSVRNRGAGAGSVVTKRTGAPLTSRLQLVALSKRPQFDRLVLATVTTVPEWHPQHDTFEPFPGSCVDSSGILDGAILVDTGVGVGNEVIDEWYRPHGHPPLSTLLAESGVAPSDIAAVVVSHLHFDHCGEPGEC